MTFNDCDDCIERILEGFGIQTLNSKFVRSEAIVLNGSRQLSIGGLFLKQDKECLFEGTKILNSKGYPMDIHSANSIDRLKTSLMSHES